MPPKSKKTGKSNRQKGGDPECFNIERDNGGSGAVKVTPVPTGQEGPLPQDRAEGEGEVAAVMREEQPAATGTVPPAGEPKEGGKKRKAKGSKGSKKGGAGPMPTEQRVMVGGRSAVVYKGSRGGQYVKKGGEYVPLSKVK
jgi:hypothetical protein